ncbi:MAG: [ribosomal protein S18]-alanine N-acetyltransferase [Thermoanaerobacteraceae bacterium]|jgi:ribosomal protein S18 acetylase RimI-like enzyme|nr:[ribosomal protein S18]-alanine N-acetyltransferase [Thermoanaerobacteraceae bacterium]
MRIIPATIQHIEAVVDIFCSAFESSISFFAPVNLKLKKAFKDVFTLLHLVFGKGFMVAVMGDEVCGYIVMADNIKRLWLGTVFSGFLVKMAAKAIFGAYCLNLSTIFKVIKNKLFYMKFEMLTISCGQLLSIAVLPRHHGKGIGKRLLEAGINYMESRGIKRIKLEVRPDNTPAVRMYEKYGFRPAGRAKDLQGDWLIMVRECS